MEIDHNVYHSDITKGDCKGKDHLYELLKIEPAEPVPRLFNCNRKETWEFNPNYEKHYIPRKGSKLKVQTVKDIRALLENDVYAYLVDDLEKQKTFLLRKIRDGSLNDDKTKDTACKIFKTDTPISRSAWQMLTNINPEEHNHPKQYVLWNGKCIQVNGSRGGKTKFICNYDLKNSRKPKLKNTSAIFKKNVLKPRIGLLRNSLNVKFKPGPLGKKKFLDDSHHKYQMNHIELAKLPKPALEISPVYGTVLEPAISNFITQLRGETGVISRKFADFAVSVLGTLKDNTLTQLDKECCINFGLEYKCDQNRILMRRNIVETSAYTNVIHDSIACDNTAKEPITMLMNNDNECDSNVSMIEIKTMINDILDTVEISLMQDSMYSTGIYESREIVEDVCAEMSFITKDRPKRKYLELDKLDVTVIKLPENSRQDNTKPCEKLFCSLGCICESLECVFNLKQHCGVLDCMFGCKCEVSKYKDIDLLERDCSEIIPGLLNLDNEINSRLAKEEQKFHQTVIVSGEKSIVLKSRKRNCKAAKKYAEFYDQVNVQSDDKIKKILTVDIQKLNCKTIEPFCMVHNLYKCFCKGKFTESSVSTVTGVNETNTMNILNNNDQAKLEQEITIGGNPACKLRLSTEKKSNEKYKGVSVSESNSFVDLCSDDSDLCARTTGFTGRKFTDAYYKNTNYKILEMEKNDDLLKKKMLKLISVANKNGLQAPNEKSMSSESLNNDEVTNKLANVTEDISCTFSNVQGKSIPKASKVVINKPKNIIGDVSYPFSTIKDKTNLKDNNTVINDPENNTGDLSYPFSNVQGKSSLKTWLESSYKIYKERIGQGVLKNSLEAPKKGKAALQSWAFILSRYKERKNIFLVTKQEPFRTFLAVDAKNPSFANCINIDSIRFVDLHKYPQIIRNLATSTTDSKNSFCILRGWNHCWELIGSAVKVIEHTAGNQSESIEQLKTQDFGNIQDNDIDDWANQRASFCLDNELPSPENNECKEIAKNSEQYTNNPEKSKWFVMTVENDFTEIQFYKKGFYVTYDGIQRSIYIARIYGKTVRLSLQTRTEKNSLHQFGIYAIPFTSESCVFIGPYEMHEPLGIEVVKAFTDSRKQRKTRGVWITTDKVDDMKVIERPLSFMPSISIPNESMVMLDGNSDSDANNKPPLSLNTSDNQNKDLPKNNAEKDAAKIVKPIKIRRTNGFYHLTNKILQKISPNKQSLLINKSINLNKTVLVQNPASLTTDDAVVWHNTEETSDNTFLTISKPIAEVAPQVNKSEDSSPESVFIKPVAEIAPQIKITSVFSHADIHKETVNSNKSKGSMLILKPEEINKKVLANSATNDDDGVSMDIEKFLVTSMICVAPQDEVFVISDCEDEDTTPCTDVWIECCSIDDFGYIRGRLKNKKLLSFEFPGFKYSNFCSETEAIEKINEVLARKVYKPQNVILKWQVVEKEEHLKSKILTQDILRNKHYLLNKLQAHQQSRTGDGKTKRSHRTYSKNNATEEASPSKQPVLDWNEGRPMTVNETIELIEDLEETSRELDNQSILLWNEAIGKREALISSLNVPDNLKDGMTEKLQDIIMSLDE